MPLLDPPQVLKLKLESLTAPDLKSLCVSAGIGITGSKAQIVGRVLAAEIGHENVDAFMKKTYVTKIERRRAIISDSELHQELSKVTSFSWGVVQGQLDRKIQTEYVRKIARYDDLRKEVVSGFLGKSRVM